MDKYDEEVLAKVNEVYQRNINVMDDYENVISQCPKRLMSVGIDIYGMFFPDNEVYKKHIYKGKLTTNEKKKNYAYYFDKDGKLRLTERFTPGDGLANIIFYYYYEDYIEIVWFTPKFNGVSGVGFIEYNNGILTRYVNADDAELDLKKLGYINNYTEDKYDIEKDCAIRRSFLGKFYKNDKELLIIGKW